MPQKQMKCTKCKDTGKILLLYSYVDCECSRLFQSAAPISRTSLPDKVYFRRIIVSPQESQILKIEKECSPASIYLVYISYNDPCKSLEIDLLSVMIGDKLQKIPFLPKHTNIPISVEWDDISSNKPLEMEFYNPSSELAMVYCALWAY